MSPLDQAIQWAALSLAAYVVWYGLIPLTLGTVGLLFRRRRA